MLASTIIYWRQILTNYKARITYYNNRKKIVKSLNRNQAEQNEALQENIPEQEEEEDEKQNFINFLTKSIYKLKGNTGLSEFVTGSPESFQRSTNINELCKTELLPLLDKDDKREARLSIQYGLKTIFWVI